MILRIEDIDSGRLREDAVEGIFEDLARLGIRWDGDVWFQSRRTGVYASALERLASDGLVYPCFCTRKDIAEASTAPHGMAGPSYPGTCRTLDRAESEARIADGRPFALRLDCERAFARTGPLSWTDRERGTFDVGPGFLSDFVVARKDAPVSYALCVVVDDAAQGVTLVTRGEDLIPATAPQRLLQALLGLPEPYYLHHPLVTDADGKRLSKRDGSVTVAALRASGLAPDEVRRMSAPR